jgi:hypothetical protein
MTVTVASTRRYRGALYCFPGTRKVCVGLLVPDVCTNHFHPDAPCHAIPLGLLRTLHVDAPDHPYAGICCCLFAGWVCPAALVLRASLAGPNSATCPKKRPA